MLKVNLPMRVSMNCRQAKLCLLLSLLPYDVQQITVSFFLLSFMQEDQVCV